MDDGLEHNPTVSRRALEQHHQACFAWALLLTGHDRAAAEDVLQQTYLLVVSGKARYRERAALKTWLFAVVRRVARRAARRRRLEQAVGRRLSALAAHHDGAAQEPRPSDGHGRLQQAVEALPSRQRELLGLVFYGGFTVEQAARVLGIGVGSARTHYHRAKLALRRALEADREG